MSKDPPSFYPVGTEWEYAQSKYQIRESTLETGRLLYLVVLWVGKVAPHAIPRALLLYTYDGSGMTLSRGTAN